MATKMSKNGVDFFQVDDAPDSVQAALDKGYKPYLDVSKDGKEVFTIEGSEDSVTAAIGKGYKQVAEFKKARDRYDNPLSLPEPVAEGISTFNDSMHAFGNGVLGGDAVGKLGDLTRAALDPDKDYAQIRKETLEQRQMESDRTPIGTTTLGVAGSFVAPSGPTTLAGRVSSNVLDAASRGESLDEVLDNAKTAGVVSTVFEGIPYLYKGGKWIASKIDDVADASGRSKAVRDYITGKFGKAARLATGIDADAAQRQFERPRATARAEGDDFQSILGTQAKDELEFEGQNLGKKVEVAGDKFLEKHGDEVFDASSITEDITKFLDRNKNSAKGFSGLTSDQYNDLNQLASMLKSNTSGEDLFKLREHLDHLEKLAGKYDIEGVSPYVRQLKSIGGQADKIIDTVDNNLNLANSNYVDYLGNKKLLSAIANEGQAEQAVGNLYGANKAAKQEAAKKVLSTETLNKIKDINANKAFDKQGPAGSEMGLRNMIKMGLALPTGGLYPLMTDATVWKHGLRVAGKVSESIKNFDRLPPNVQKVLSDAFDRGPSALAVTHMLLMKKDSGYKSVVEESN